MSYTLQAMIGTTDSLPEATTGLTPIQLSERLWMAPLSSAVRDRYSIPLLPFDEDDHDELPAALRLLGCALSRRGLVAYVEAAFWGGSGIQASALFKDGAEIARPVIAKDAINRALKLLGAIASADRDEFDTVGLGRHRHTEEWGRPAHE